VLCWHGSSFLLRNLLLDALMWSCLVEVRHIGIQDAVELLLMEDEQLIEARTLHTAQEPLTDGIGAWGVIGGFEHLDATRFGNPCEGHPKLALLSKDEVLRSDTKGGSFPKRFGRPRIGGRSPHAYVDHFARVQKGVEEGEQRTEEKVRYWQKVASPDLLSMRL
jgi:hypothetical protein